MAPSWFVYSFPGPLGRWLRRAQPVAAAAAEPPADPLLTVGLMLRRHREARGLSLRQLANETRISTPVLEALERGWRERLPETAYLRTMLPLLEQHLAMPAGSMANALPQQAPPVHDGWDSSRQPFLSRFTPGSIDVFTTWQGSVLYALISLGLLYGLNIQQQRLAAANQLTLRPVSPLPLAMQEARLMPMTSCSRPIRNCGRCGWPNGAWRCNGCGGWRAATPCHRRGCCGCSWPNRPGST